MCEDWVSAYLNSLPICRSELNLLFQQMKLGSFEYTRNKVNEIYYVEVIGRIYFEGRRAQFKGHGASANYKHAC
jgi:hypothetical protein